MPEPKTPSSPAAPPSGIPEEIKKRLDTLDERLETIDHYTLLGIARTATRAQVRSALLSAAPAFHPDRYFGKKIDPAYAAKMQRVFARMAMAHDTLIDDARRAHYDRALPPPLPPPVPEAPPPTSPPAAEKPSESPRRPASSSPSTSSSPSPSPSPLGVSHGSAPVPGPMRPPSASSPEFERSRAQAFAARLAGNNRMRAPTPVHAFQPGVGPRAGQPPPPRSVSSTTMPAVDPKAAVDALKRRYEESMARAHTKQASSQLQAAEGAAARGDHGEAARLYRAAIEGASDPATKASLEQAERHAREQGRAADMAKAKELEQRQEYGPAAAAWVRVFEIAPSADVANRAAACYRRSGTDVRRATKYGEEAVKLDPKQVAYRVTLALAYAEAGLGLRARGEIERAQALDPKSASVKDAAQKIKSMG